MHKNVIMQHEAFRISLSGRGHRVFAVPTVNSLSARPAGVARAFFRWPGPRGHGVQPRLRRRTGGEPMNAAEPKLVRSVAGMSERLPPKVDSDECKRPGGLLSWSLWGHRAWRRAMTRRGRSCGEYEDCVTMRRCERTPVASFPEFAFCCHECRRALDEQVRRCRASGRRARRLFYQAHRGGPLVRHAGLVLWSERSQWLPF